MFKSLSNLFKPLPKYALNEEGCYFYKYRGKSRYGGFIEIYYIVIFKKLPEVTDEGYNYMAYLTNEFDTELNLTDILAAHRLIKSYDLDDLMAYDKKPEEYTTMYCKLNDKNIIEFKKDTLFDPLKMGTLMVFEGFVGDNYLRLSHLIVGYNDSDKLITEKIYDLAKFDFKHLP